MTVPVAILLGIALFAGAWLYGKWRTLRRAEFIRTFRWPRGLLERLEKHHAGFERKDSALVSRGLRQFFLAYLMSGKRHVSMPSQSPTISGMNLSCTPATTTRSAAAPSAASSTT